MYKSFLLHDFPMSMGLSLLVISPYFMENVGTNPYFVFDILEAILIPHIQAVGVFGLLIYSAILISRYCGITSRWLIILISALFLLFVFRGFLSMAGTSPQSMAYNLQVWLSFLGLDWLNYVTIKRVGVFVLFGFGLVILPRIVRDHAPLFRACAAFGWVMGVITIFRVVPIMEADAEFSKIRHQISHDELFTAAVDKRVVWVIFDELDYNRTFKNRNPNLTLPNLDRLQHESVSAMNAVSPAWATAISIPALTTGTYLPDTNPDGPGRLLLHKQGSMDIEWGNASSVFSRLNDGGKKINILGFYHPYCSVFPYASPCLSRPAAAYPAWWWGIWHGLRTIPGIDLLARKYKWTTEGFNKTTRLQLDAIDSYISNKSTSLSFIHLNIPHLPGHRASGVPLTKENKFLPGYEQNLLTVDWTVGKIVQSLEAQSHSQDILLIVSSDHWLRTKLHSKDMSPDQFKWEFGNDSAEVHRIPLLIRRMREKSQYEILQPISTVHTTRLIEDFIAGRVTDHASIATWWLDKPYVEPMIPEEYKVL